MDLNLFRAVNRDYVPEFDLDTVSNVYNTLQQRHDKAVIQESAVKKAIGDLQLNAQEDEFKQKLADRIDTIVQAEMIDGFKGYALNELIEEQGNIFSDPQVIGRLRAQQEYKTYQENLNNRKDLSEDKKNYFREINHYYYEDKYDATGKVIGGTEWKPIKQEVSEIPLIEIIKGGISLAAKEKGSNNITRFIDKNGNVTTEPTAENVFDGEVYNTTTQSWERLGRDKIMQGINAYIEGTPGAKASLQQDYNIAIYKKRKYGSNPDVEDSKGVELSPEQYLLKRIEPGVNAAIYNNSNVITTYGNGLKTYKSALKAQQANAQKQLQDPYRLPGYSTENIPITINYDYAANLQTDKQNSLAALNNIIKTITGENIKQDMTNATSNDWRNLIEKTITNSNLTPAEKSKLILEGRKAIRKLEEADINYKELTKNITDETQLDALNFVSKINGGAEIDANTKYGADVIKEINSIFGDKGKYIRMTTDNEDYFNEMKSLISGNDINGLKELGYTIGTDNKGNKYIQLDKNNYNQIISFANASKKARKVLNYLFDTSGIYFTVLTDNYDTNKSFDEPVYKTSTSIATISQIYDDANNIVNKYISNISPQQITISNENLPYQTFTEQKLLNDYNLGKIDEQQYNIYDKRLKADLENKLINTNYPQVNIFTIEDVDGVGTLNREIESKDRLEIGKLIKAAVGAGRYKASAAHNAVHGNGTNITIYPATDQDGSPKGDAQTFFIPGIILEQAGVEFDNSPKTIASDKITLGNETNRKIYLTSSIETPTLGSQTIDCLGNNQFIYKTDSGSYNISRNAAVDITENIENYHQIKDSLISGDIYQDTNYSVEEINNGINEQIKIIASKIAIAYGRPEDYEYIKTALLNDLKE